MLDQETRRILEIEDTQYRIKKDIESLKVEFMRHVHNQLPAEDLIEVFVTGEEHTDVPLPNGSKSIKWGTEIYCASRGSFSPLKIVSDLILRQKKHFYTFPFEIHGKRYEIQVTST